MSNYAKLFTLVSIGTTMLNVAGILQAQSCHELTDASLEQAVTYIETAEANQSPKDCFFAAFAVIKSAPKQRQIPILVRLLPYRWPHNSEGGISHTGPGGPLLFYPAIESLLDLSPASEPAVLDYIENDPDRNRTGWENAVLTYAMSVARHRSVDSLHLIGLLKGYRAGLRDPAAANRITDAIRFITAKYCGDPQATAACQAAADSP